MTHRDKEIDKTFSQTLREAEIAIRNDPMTTKKAEELQKQIEDTKKKTRKTQSTHE